MRINKPILCWKESFLVVLFSFITLSVHASNTIAISGGDVPTGEKVEININIDNDDPFVAFQLDIPLPVELNFVGESASLNEERITDHVFSVQIVGESTLRIFSYSPTNSPYIGNTGSILSFELIADYKPGAYHLTAVNPIISGTAGVNILTNAFQGTVNILGPDIQANPLVVNFGRIPLTSYLDAEVIVQNNGNQVLEVSGVNIESPLFEVLSEGVFDLQAGEFTQINVRFYSVIKGDYEQNMFITSNDPKTPEINVSLKATAYAVNELRCGNVFASSGEEKELGLAINNMEAFVGFQFDLQLPSPLSYIEGSVALTDRKADHLVSASMINANTLRVVAYSPSNQSFNDNDGEIVRLAFGVFGEGGWYSLSLSNVILANLAGENIVSAFFNGLLEITAPNIFSNGSVAFGDVSVLETKTSQLRVFNYGSDLLNIDQLSITNPSFTINQNLPLQVSPGSYVDMEVHYSQGQKGYQEGVLRIYSNDPNDSPHEVVLSATSFAPNYLYIKDSFGVFPEIITVEVHVDNYETFVAFEFELEFPHEVLKFLPDASGTKLSDRASDHVLNTNLQQEGTLHVFAYSLSQALLVGSSGSIVQLAFEITSSREGEAFPLIIREAILSSDEGENILYESTDGSLFMLEELICPSNLEACINTPPFPLTGASPTGGNYSGPGVNEGIFYPNLAGIGTHTITYAYDYDSGYWRECHFSIQVHALPNVSLADLEPVCSDTPPFTLTGGLPQGGSYSGIGVTESGEFDPSLSGPGTFEISYTYQDDNGCEATATKEIHVCETADLPDLVSLYGITVNSGQTECYNANITITVAGAQGLFIVEPGGIATLVARQNIIMLPGTHLSHGSQVAAYIAPNGPFCGEADKHFLAADDEPISGIGNSKSLASEVITELSDSEGFVNVYPNPTTGRVTLELRPSQKTSKAYIEIIGMRGEILIRKTLFDDQTIFQFTLENQMPGIYFIRVIQGDKFEVKRIIKH